MIARMALRSSVCTLVRLRLEPFDTIDADAGFATIAGW